jgi:A/G-specific adenine glycosylase
MSIESTAMSVLDVLGFQKTIYAYYAVHKRSFVWRFSADPYHIVVSEIMLQQTQTYRVEGKFEQFVALFPTFDHLARAPLRDVLAAWQGLGYNRRGLALHKLAHEVTTAYGGFIPPSSELLVALPGIGKATAASICAFAFNKPTLFIETNIRSVFIYFFFKNRSNVADKEILPLVELTLDYENPRQWYYALMDYGVMLKKNLPNPSRKSAHYTKQSKFEGSERQIRGLILKALTTHRSLAYGHLVELIQKEPARVKKNLGTLCAEGFVRQQGKFFEIT